VAAFFRPFPKDPPPKNTEYSLIKWERILTSSSPGAAAAMVGAMFIFVVVLGIVAIISGSDGRGT
jgi:hypothetical protein